MTLSSRGLIQMLIGSMAASGSVSFYHGWENHSINTEEWSKEHDGQGHCRHVPCLIVLCSCSGPLIHGTHVKWHNLSTNELIMSYKSLGCNVSKKNSYAGLALSSGVPSGNSIRKRAIKGNGVQNCSILLLETLKGPIRTRKSLNYICHFFNHILVVGGYCIFKILHWFSCDKKHPLFLSPFRCF